jgi:hypothetical protein
MRGKSALTNYGSFKTARDLVEFVQKKNEDFGIDGYYVEKTCEFDKQRKAGIWKGTKKTYIDENVALHKFVPPIGKYDVATNILPKTLCKAKNLLPKDLRRTMTVMIENKEKKDRFPGPGHV